MLYKIQYNYIPLVLGQPMYFHITFTKSLHKISSCDILNSVIGENKSIHQNVQKLLKLLTIIAATYYNAIYF